MAYEYEFIKHIEGAYSKAFLISINRRLYHWHNDIELLLVLEGSVVVNTSVCQYFLKKDDIFLINSNEIHSLTRNEEANIILAIQFDPKLSKSYFPKLQRLKFLDKLIDKRESPQCWEKIRKGLADFMTDYYKKEYGYQFKLISTLNMLIYNLLQYMRHEFIVEDMLFNEQKNLERLNRIIIYIQENYANKVSLKDLAAAENLDMYYLSHFIKKQLGISFQQYLNKIRLEKAAELLIQTNWKQIDICVESGFSDYRYLSKMFAKEYGCTPSQYKQQYKNLEPAVAPPDTGEQHKFFNQYEAIEKIISYSVGKEVDN